MGRRFFRFIPYCLVIISVLLVYLSALFKAQRLTRLEKKLKKKG